MDNTWHNAPSTELAKVSAGLRRAAAGLGHASESIVAWGQAVTHATSDMSAAMKPALEELKRQHPQVFHP